MENISPYLLLGISIVAGLIGGISRTYYCKWVSGTLRSYYLLNAACSAICAVLLWALGGFGIPTFSGYTLLLGVVFGTVTMVQCLTNSAALNLGPWSYTSVIISLATIIPTISGVLFWQESMGFTQIMGILLLVVCFVLSVDISRDNKAASLHWFLLCFIAFLCTGAIGVMQKVHQSSPHKNELSAFLIVAFLVSALISFLIFLFYPKKALRKLPAPQKKVSVAVIAVLFLFIGIATALTNQFNLYLSGVMPSAVFFPVVNGGGLVLTTIASVLVFRERLSLRQWIGLGVGMVSVLLLCM